MWSSSFSRSAARVTALLVVIVSTAHAQPALDTTEVAVSGPDGAMLFVDGKQLGPLPLADTVILAAGPHRFQLQAGSRKVESDALQLPANRMAELHLSLSGRSLVAVLHMTPALLLRLEPDGLPQALVDAIWQSVARAARQEHTMLLRRDRQAALSRQSSALSRCLDGQDCHEPFFENGEVSFVLALKLDRDGAGPSPDYGLRAALLDVRTRDYSLRIEERCAACGAEALATQLGSITRRVLSETLQRARGTLDVTSTPAGAKVFVDGRWLGRTPFKQEQYAGKHIIELEREGYQAEEQTLTLEAGQTAAAQLVLSRPSPASPPPLVPARRVERTRPLGRLITGSILLGSGLLLGGFGISALVMNGQCLDGSDQLDVCSPILNTRAVGSALLASGAVLTVTGTLVLAIPERRRKLLAQAGSSR